MFVKRGIARAIKDSRGEKTIEIEIITSKGKVMASAPSGKSKGANEVPDYNPRGLNWSLRLANILLKSWQNKNLTLNNIKDIDSLEKYIKEFEISHGPLGGNTIYAIETAVLKATAKENNMSLWRFIFNSLSDVKKVNLPSPVGNCLGGGLHSKGVGGKKPDFQEFLLISEEGKVSKRITKNIHAYLYAKSLVRKRNAAFLITRNDEGAWNTGWTNEETLEVLRKVADKFDLKIGVDIASSTFFKKNYYQYENKDLIRDRAEQVEYMAKLVNKYGISYLEDPLNEEDFPSFRELMAKVGKKTMIVGDDLTTTNLKRVDRAHRANAINALIVKPNQIGSVGEVIKVIEFCKKNRIKIIFSHRSGETMDDALADYAVGFQADYIKAGIYGKERLIKLRRLMQIEKEIGE